VGGGERVHREGGFTKIFTNEAIRFQGFRNIFYSQVSSIQTDTYLCIHSSWRACVAAGQSCWHVCAHSDAEIYNQGPRRL